MDGYRSLSYVLGLLETEFSIVRRLSGGGLYGTARKLHDGSSRACTQAVPRCREASPDYCKTRASATSATPRHATEKEMAASLFFSSSVGPISLPELPLAWQSGSLEALEGGVEVCGCVECGRAPGWQPSAVTGPITECTALPDE